MKLSQIPKYKQGSVEIRRHKPIGLEQLTLQCM